MLLHFFCNPDTKLKSESVPFQSGLCWSFLLRGTTVKQKVITFVHQQLKLFSSHWLPAITYHIYKDMRLLWIVSFSPEQVSTLKHTE